MNRHLVRAISLAVVVLMTPATVPPVAAAQAAQLRPAMDATRLKSALINIPTGTPIRVRTRDGAQVAGKLMQLSDEGIEMQALTGGRIETRALRFADIAGLSTGPRKSLVARTLGPVLTIVSLAGTVGAITAAVKK